MISEMLYIITAGKPPFKTSKNKHRKPANGPNVLPTFAEPKFLLPNFLTSIL